MYSNRLEKGLSMRRDGTASLWLSITVTRGSALAVVESKGEQAITNHNAHRTGSRTLP